MSTKTLIRQRLRAERKALNKQAQQLASKQLAQHLLCLPSIKQAKHIAAYWPNDGEISPLAALKIFQRQGKYLYLPTVLPNGQLIFKHFHIANSLLKNSYGIPEPVSKGSRPAYDLDIVLMPLVAFDKQGNRLGMGGGYYDKTFAFIKQDLWRKKPLLVGLAHHFQQVDVLKQDNWDIPLTTIVTNQKTWHIKKGLISP
jgi:5-formyltetrahydrofolate cyclo-ligase